MNRLKLGSFLVFSFCTGTTLAEEPCNENCKVPSEVLLQWIDNNYKNDIGQSMQSDMASYVENRDAKEFYDVLQNTDWQKQECAPDQNSQSIARRMAMKYCGLLKLMHLWEIPYKIQYEPNDYHTAYYIFVVPMVQDSNKHAAAFKSLVTCARLDKVRVFDKKVPTGNHSTIYTKKIDVCWNVAIMIYGKAQYWYHVEKEYKPDFGSIEYPVYFVKITIKREANEAGSSYGYYPMSEESYCLTFSLGNNGWVNSAPPGVNCSL